MASGDWIIAGLNTYTGATTVSVGTLHVTSIGSSTTAGNLGENNGDIVLGSGNTAAATLLYTGTGETTSRNIAPNGGSGNSIIQQDGANGHAGLIINGAFTSVQAANTTRTFVLQGSNTDANAFNGAISELGGTKFVALTKNGIGNWMLGGSNTYSGATTVGAGTLKLGPGGSLGNTTVSVSSGATFGMALATGGNTVISGTALALANGSILNLQDGVTNTLKINGAAALNGATLDFDLGASSADKLQLAGAAAHSNMNTFSFAGTAGTLATGTHAYTLITSSGGLSTSNFAAPSTITVAGNVYALALDADANDLWLNVTSGGAATVPALSIASPAAAARALVNSSVGISGQISTTAADFNAWTLSDGSGNMGVSAFNPSSGSTAVGAPTSYSASVVTGTATGLRTYNVTVANPFETATAGSTLTVVAPRVVSAAPLDLSGTVYHAGTTLGSIATTATLTSSGGHGTTTDVSVNGMVTFNGSNNSQTLSVTGTGTLSTSGTVASLPVTTLETGLNDTYANVNVLYTGAQVFSGNGKWTSSSGSLWSAGGNWTDAGGVHGASRHLCRILHGHGRAGRHGHSLGGPLGHADCPEHAESGRQWRAGRLHDLRQRRQHNDVRGPACEWRQHCRQQRHPLHLRPGRAGRELGGQHDGRRHPCNSPAV